MHLIHKILLRVDFLVLILAVEVDITVLDKILLVKLVITGVAVLKLLVDVYLLVRNM